MKADFEKGTKVCSCCKKELPLDMFNKNKSKSDGLHCYCKKCECERIKIYFRSDEGKKKKKEYDNKKVLTFGRTGHKRGNNGMLKRDCDLSKEQLRRRNMKRKYSRRKQRKKGYGILIWYSGKLEELSTYEYKNVMTKEYCAQKRCAIRGYVGRTQTSEHFLFDFDLEQMLNDNAYNNLGGDKRQYITKWWKGEIRHWTVKDGIWKE